MDLIQASTYMFRDRAWPRKYGLIAIFSLVPMLGHLYGYGYANQTLRKLVDGDEDGQTLPDARLSWDLCWLGIQVILISMICAVAVAFVGAPLFIGQESSLDAMAPALVHALQGPSALLVTAVSAVVTAVAMVRFAVTRRFGGAFDLVTSWKLLRAEPAMWIAAGVIGYLAVEGPYALVWALPLKGAWEFWATILASTVMWSYGQMINAYLIGDAYAWSKKTAALRSAEVRYHW
jgi:hypothetical protein